MGVTLINAASAIALLVLLRRHYCARCVNFGCLLNNTAPNLRSAYHARNPDIKRSWDKAGGHTRDIGYSNTANYDSFGL